MTIYLPDRAKDECTVMISEGRESHPGPHKCNAEKHHCPARCPDCGCFCEFEPGHRGDHQAEAHRNKTRCIYIHKENMIEVETSWKKTGATFATAGEIATPEFCIKSCERKGRGHFHPIACPGYQGCLMTLYRGKAWHRDTELKGTNITHWDMLECRMYYKHYGWRAPIDTILGSREQDKFTLCPFFCSEKHESTQYCERLLFHSMSAQRKDHFFTCRHPCAECFDVCFVLDCTGSMGWCFRKVIDILKSVLRERAGSDIKFAIVAYTDHKEESKGMMADQLHPV
ncbi:MAG: VWA domain-containing protein, partial [Actinobacteria bacterium]|nr:VWA domain-containing protein [Actinomycetota bacterium]